MAGEQVDLERRICEIQEKFYEDSSEGGKNMFFGKKAQKRKCATAILDEIPLETLLRRTIFEYESNSVVVDYPILKTFAHEDNFATISEKGLSAINALIARNGYYNVHINLQGLTASGMERCSGLIEVFFAQMQPSDTHFNDCLRTITVYNAPSFFWSLHSLVNKFITSDTTKIVTRVLTKPESEIEFANLLSRATF